MKLGIRVTEGVYLPKKQQGDNRDKGDISQKWGVPSSAL